MHPTAGLVSFRISTLQFTLGENKPPSPSPPTTGVLLVGVGVGVAAERIGVEINALPCLPPKTTADARAGSTATAGFTATGGCKAPGRGPPRSKGLVRGRIFLTRGCEEVEIFWSFERVTRPWDGVAKLRRERGVDEDAFRLPSVLQKVT